MSIAGITHEYLVSELTSFIEKTTEAERKKAIELSQQWDQTFGGYGLQRWVVKNN